MDLKDEIQKAVIASMSAEILKRITTEDRDAILQKSIEGALKDWTFQATLNKAVAEKAQEVAVSMLNSDKWHGRIVKAVQEGCDAYLADLPMAVKKALIQSMHGTTGNNSYENRPGAVLSHLARKE